MDNEQIQESRGDELLPLDEDELDSWLYQTLHSQSLGKNERIQSVVEGSLRAANVALSTEPLTPQERKRLRRLVAESIRHDKRDLMDFDDIANFGSETEQSGAQKSISSIAHYLSEVFDQGGVLNVWTWSLVSSSLGEAFTRAAEEQSLAPSVRRRYAQLAYCCADASRFGVGHHVMEDQDGVVLEQAVEMAAVMLKFARTVQVEAAHASSAERKRGLWEHALGRIVDFVTDERADITTVGVGPRETSNDRRFVRAVDQVRFYLKLCKEQYAILREIYHAFPENLAEIYRSELNVTKAIQRYLRNNIYDATNAPPKRRIIDHFSWDCLSRTTLVERLHSLECGESLLSDLHLTCIELLTAMGKFFCEAGDTRWSFYANGLASHHWAAILVDQETREAVDPTDPRLLDRCEVETRAARSLAELDPHWAQFKLATGKWAASRLGDIDRERVAQVLAENQVIRARIHVAFGRMEAATYAIGEARRELQSAGIGDEALHDEIAHLEYLASGASGDDPLDGLEGPSCRWPRVVDRSLQALLGIMGRVASATDASRGDGVDQAQDIVNKIGAVLVPIRERLGNPREIPDLGAIEQELIGRRKRATKGPGRALVEGFEWVCDITQRTLPLVALHTFLTQEPAQGDASVGEHLLGVDAMRDRMEKAADLAEKRGHWLSAVECRLWLANASKDFKPPRWQEALDAMDQWMAEVPAGVDRIHSQERWWPLLQAAVARVIEQSDPNLLPFAVQVGEKLRARSLLDFYDIGQEPILEELPLSPQAALGMLSERVSDIGELMGSPEHAPKKAHTQPDGRFAHIVDWQHQSVWYRPAASTEEIHQYLTDAAANGMPIQVISFYTSATNRVHWLVQELGGVRGGELPIGAVEVRNIRRSLQSYASVADGRLEEAGAAWKKAFGQLCIEDLSLYAGQLQRLHECVIRPMCDAGVDMSDEVVTYFVANRDTLGLPLHAAKDEQSGQFLIERALIAYTPSASCLVRMERDAHPPKVAACLAYGCDLGMDKLVDHVGTWGPQGESLREFRSWCRSGRTAFEWLFLGGHGSTPEDGENPWEAFIKLRDGHLKPLDLLHVCADFAFVASCNVGRQQAHAGDTYGFLFGLMSGGTRSCVLADMPVYVDVAKTTGPLAKIPHRIYQMTHEDAPKISAYTEAVRHVIDSEWEHPYFWAPFHFYGEAGPLGRFRH